MALTRQQFQELRDEGLSVDQIVNFEKGETPQKEPSAFQKFRSFADKTSGRGTQLAKGTARFFGGNVIDIGKGLVKSVEESVREIGGQKVPIREGFDVAGRGKTPSLLETGGAVLETTPLGTGVKVAKKVAQVIKTPLTRVAEKLFQSALKPRDVKKAGQVVTKAEEIVKIGLKERIWLTKGGVERVANKIDNLEGQLGDAIDAGRAKGVKVATAGLKDFVDEAKGFFKDQVNVKKANKAIKDIDDIAKSFITKYGKEIPIEEAQRIKVKTGQALRKYYNTMSSAEIEGEKQLVRGLKEGIVKVAPKVKDVNARLSDLFKFDQALSKASGRIGNLNLLGLGTKIGLGAGGDAKRIILGAFADIADAPSIKSGLAIGINELTKGAGAGIEKGRVPVSIIIANLLKLFRED